MRVSFSLMLSLSFRLKKSLIVIFGPLNASRHRIKGEVRPAAAQLAYELRAAGTRHCRAKVYPKGTCTKFKIQEDARLFRLRTSDFACAFCCGFGFRHFPSVLLRTTTIYDLTKLRVQRASSSSAGCS